MFRDDIPALVRASVAGRRPNSVVGRATRRGVSRDGEEKRQCGEEGGFMCGKVAVLSRDAVMKGEMKLSP